MSWQAMTWVLNECDADEYVEFRLLMSLADRADENGAGAWPSVASLAQQIRRSPRTVQRGLERLQKAGRIRLGDQRLVPSNLPINRRPKVWDVVLSEVTSAVTPEPLSDVTTVVTPKDFGVTHGDALGVTPVVVLGVTPDDDRTSLHSLRNETTHPTETARRAREDAAKPNAAPNRISELRDLSARGWPLVLEAIPETFPDDDRATLAQHAGRLLDEGKEPALVLATLKFWTTKQGAGPKLLPYLVSDVARDIARAGATTGQPPMAGNDREVTEIVRSGYRLAQKAREQQQAREQQLLALPAGKPRDLFTEILHGNTDNQEMAA